MAAGNLQVMQVMNGIAFCGMEYCGRSSVIMVLQPTSSRTKPITILGKYPQYLIEIQISGCCRELPLAMFRRGFRIGIGTGQDKLLQFIPLQRISCKESLEDCLEQLEASNEGIAYFGCRELNGGKELRRHGSTKRNTQKWELNPGSIPKVAPTGVEPVNRIKDMAEHF